jgi:O-antigen/teichoic acid export membrane protein
MDTIVPWYLGNDFKPTSTLVVLLSITLSFVSFANVIRTQYLIPMEKDKIYVTSVIIGAILNLIFNYIFIPTYGAKGACFGTIVAEISVMVYQTLCIRKEINIKKYLKNWITILLKSVISFAPVLLLNNILNEGLLRVIVQVLVFGILYVALNLRYVINNIGFLNKLVRR